MIRQPADRDKRTLLDGAELMPEGDLFGVTRLHPDEYIAVSKLGRGGSRIHVRLPKGERYRADQPTLVECSKLSFDPKEIEILAGRTAVFQCTALARIRVELE